MRENGDSLDKPEHKYADEDVAFRELAASVATIFFAAAYLIDRHFHGIRISECAECGATFFTIAGKEKHSTAYHSRHEDSKRSPETTSEQETSSM